MMILYYLVFYCFKLVELFVIQMQARDHMVEQLVFNIICGVIANYIFRNMDKS